MNDGANICVVASYAADFKVSWFYMGVVVSVIRLQLYSACTNQ